MQNHWEILGIESGADLRAIKHAYAAKLKTIRQDENPAEFMELREAYEVAIIQSHKDSQFSTSHIEARVWKTDLEVFENINNNITKPKFNDHSLSVFEEVLALLQQDDVQTNHDAWNSIFDDERICGIDDFVQFELVFIKHLLEETKYNENRIITDYYTQLRRYPIPILIPPISKFIFERMGWDTHNYRSQYYEEINWLAHQFGVLVNDEESEYWYYDKLELQRTLLHIKIEESDLHPGLMLLYLFGFIAGIFAIMRILGQTIFR